MIGLNNPLLSPQGILTAFRQQVVESRAPVEKATLLQSFKSKIQKMYKDVTETQYNQGYQGLKSIITAILTLEDIKDLSTLNIGIQDWQPANVEQAFKEMDERYRYFTHLDDEELKSAHALFKKIIQACRTHLILFENKSSDQVRFVYVYAYRLMALFTDRSKPINIEKQFDAIASQAYKLLNAANMDDPFHVILLERLRLPDVTQIQDMPGWQKLIRELGFKALEYFKHAPELEVDGKAPKDSVEALTRLAQLKYKRSAEDLDFSKLCLKNDVSQRMFNASLDYMTLTSSWPKKEDDNLPNITVVGEGEAKGYTWKKLDINDKRALILGEITHCCQSISENSHQCVVDGTSRSDNGFYVLMKNNEIIGQSYAWRTISGNICLDSIECLTGRIPLPALQTLLQQFTDQVVTSGAAHCVTVGKGGKTPKEFAENHMIADRMRQGIDYGDANKQYLITPTTLKQRERLPEIMDATVREYLEYLRLYLPENEQNPEVIAAFIEQNPEVKSVLTRDSFVYWLLNFNQGSICLNDLKEPAEHARLGTKLAHATKSFSTFNKILDHMSQAEKSFCCMVLYLHKPQEVLQRIKNSELNNEAIKNIASRVKTYNEFKALLDATPLQQRIAILEGLGERASNFLCTWSSATAFMNYLSKEDKDKCLDKLKFIFREAIRHSHQPGNEFLWFMAELTPEKRHDFAEIMLPELPGLIGSHYEFCNVLEYLSKEQNARFCTAIQRRLHELVRDIYECGEFIQMLSGHPLQNSFLKRAIPERYPALIKNFEQFMRAINDINRYVPLDAAMHHRSVLFGHMQGALADMITSGYIVQAEPSKPASDSGLFGFFSAMGEALSSDAPKPKAHNAVAEKLNTALKVLTADQKQVLLRLVQDKLPEGVDVNTLVYSADHGHTAAPA